MKKTILSVMALAAGAMMLVSCGGNKAANADSDTQAVDKLVEEVIADTPDSVATSPYTAQFFSDETMKSDTPSDSTYAVTASGLKYVIVKKGEGKAPKASDTVTVHYLGMLTNGEVFDTSYTRGEPTTFPLSQVIPGWTEGLQLMQEGGEAVFYIPSNLGYGPQGMGPIPPDAPLIFKVELISVGAPQQ